MAGKIVVGCKLPNGIILENPLSPDQKVELAGLNRVTIIGATYATTLVDADFWAAWSSAHKEFGPILSGAIFIAKSDADLAAMAREQVERKTGLEPMEQKSAGVKPAESD